MSGDPSFEIPARPRRQFSRTGLSYEGETVFRLTPAADRATEDLAALVATVLDEGPYRHGDFLELPMPLWLVRDDETADVFRVSVREGRVRLHVLPETEPAGLRRLYDRIDDRTDHGWSVDCRTDG
ncbi:MAG: hypothetical protein ABEH35_01310 [Haloarculaceae archaeon]